MNGSLGDREASWIRDTCAATSADTSLSGSTTRLLPEGGQATRMDYANEWRALLDQLPAVRGLGGGHTHVPLDYVFADRPVFVSPALKHNFDLDARTWLPPGYRSYEFSADGTVTSDVHLVDDDRWPRRPLGRAVVSLLSGELSQKEFDKIVARKLCRSRRR